MKRKGYSHEKTFEKAGATAVYADCDADSSGYVCSGSRDFGRCEESEAEGRIRDIGKADLVQGKGGIRLPGLSGRSGKRSGDKDCVDEKNEPYFEENCSEYGIYISGACIRKEQGYHDGECAACYDPGADFREEAGDSVRSENCRFQ